MASSFAVLGVTVFAQDDAEYQGWMKADGATSGGLRKNLAAKNADAASADAKKLQEIFGQVHNYWNGKHVHDVMKFAMAASSGSGEAADQAAAGKFDYASATLKAAAATNRGGWHNTHREKAPDGSWNIK